MAVIYVLQFSSKPCVRMRKVIDSLEENSHTVYFCGVDRGDKVDVDYNKVLHFGVPTKRGSLTKIFSLPFYIISLTIFLFRKNANKIYCADLEAGLVGLIYTVFVRSKKNVAFVYDVLDTYSERYNTSRFLSYLINTLESKVAKMASLLIHVDANRVGTLKTKAASYILVRNVPSKKTLPELKHAFSKKVNYPIEILISGGIYEHRGVRVFLKLMADKKFKESVHITAIGFGDEDIVKELSSMDNCTYLGYVDSKRAQKLSSDSDVILSLYDPTMKINRLACPNKVYDGAANSTFVLVNQDVIDGSSFESYPNVLICDYHNSESIKNQIYSIYNKSSSELYLFAQEFRKISVWEREFNPVINYFNSTY